MGTFRIEVGQDGVALLLMDVPGESANTLRADFQDEFEQAFKTLADDGAVKAIVFASAKPDSFLVGADVEMLARVKTQAEATALARGGQEAMQRLEDLGKRKPIVAAIHGPALGGGLELALASATASPPTTGRRSSASPKCSWASCRARAARSGCRRSSASRRRSTSSWPASR